MGKAVVTLPAKYLGSRWTAAYYERMMDQALIDQVVASDEEDYVAKAIRMATNPVARAEVEGRILASFHRLMRKQAAVNNWIKLLLDMAPAEDPKARTPNNFCAP
jgi:predicted O-linked N-acetylglucosamine transferase (SPINDLY family)